MRHANPTLLALDLGTRTGWALLSEGQVVSGAFDMTPVPGESPGLRFIKFRKEFLPTFRKVQEVYYEEVHRHLGTQAAHIYGAFWGILHAWCLENDIPIYPLEVSHIKQNATGKGRAKKGEMVEAMEHRGYKPESEDEADALAILSLARRRRAS